MKILRYSGQIAAGFAAILMIGCGGGERNAPPSPSDAAATATGGTVTAPAARAASAVPTDEREGVVLFVGTSLTAGLGLPAEQAYPMLIDSLLDASHLPLRAVNAGVSGETSAGAAGRIDWLLTQPFEVLVLETGANDMLRGSSPAAAERNIQTIIDRVRENRPDARIVLAGMRAAPNLGPAYVEEFNGLYRRIAEENDLPLIPFLLEGVAGDPELNQRDGIHPNAEGQRRVAENVWSVLRPVVEEVAAGSATPGE